MPENPFDIARALHEQRIADEHATDNLEFELQHALDEIDRLNAALQSIADYPANDPDTMDDALVAIHRLATDALKENQHVSTCILTGAPGEDADDCTTHDHEKR